MKKKLISAVLSTAMIASMLVGCGAQADTSAPKADDAAVEEEAEVAEEEVQSTEEEQLQEFIEETRFEVKTSLWERIFADRED